MKAAMVALVVSAGLSCTQVMANAESAPAHRHPVNVAEIAYQDSYIAKRRFSGRAVAAQRSALAFELPGTVEAVEVESGQQVAAGDVLVSLDSRLLQAQAAEVDAALVENRASLNKNIRDLERQRSLKTKGYSAQQAIDDLTAQGKVLRAQRERLEAQRRAVELRLEKSVLKAPFSGEVVAKSVDVGVTVKEGQPALEIVEIGDTEAVIGIPEVLYSAVSNVDEVTVRGFFGETQATVVSVSQTVNPNTLTHSVRIRFPADVAIADGSIVYMLVDQTINQRGFWLPLSSLLEGYRGTWSVFALNQDNTLEKRSVSPLYQEGGRVFVEGELDDGSQVVINGVHRYAAGQIVQVAEQ
nr:efflux RND transporter periplasmic adaptor subunit [Litorivivens lipolytica]